MVRTFNIRKTELT